MRFHSIKERDMKFHQCEKNKNKNRASSLKSLKFIMSRGIQDSSKRNFVKKGKIHQAQKGTSASRQERSLESASKGPKSIKLRKIGREKCPQKFISPTKKKAR